MRRSHLRLGARLARRELRRRPWRTALVLLMVLVPSAAMTLVTISIRTGEWDAEDQHRAGAGRVDVSAYRDDDGEPTRADLDTLLAALPPGTRMEVTHGGQDRIRTAERRTYPEVSDTRLDDPINEGRFGALRGRLPRSGREVVITTEVAEQIDAGIGDRFRLDGLERDVRVVGVVRPNASNESVYVGARLAPSPDIGTRVVFDLPDGLDVLRAAESAAVPGWQLNFEGPSDRGDSAGIFWVYVGGGVGLIVLGTVITAAFAVGARRQLRSIGLLTASGASPVTVKWFLVAQGALAGALGSITGAVLAIVGTRFVPNRFVEDVAGRPISGPVVRVADLVPIVLIGTVVAAGASWLPARSASRVPTLQALAGRRPLPKVPRRLPVMGAGSVAAGCALLAMAVAGVRRRGASDGSSLWALVAIAGGLAVVLGTISIAPWVVAGLERGGRGLFLGGRLASRSLARNRVRSSAVIGAICAVSIAVVAGSTLYASSGGADGEERPWQRPSQVLVESSTMDAGESVARPAPDVVDRVRRAVPDSVVIPILSPELPRPTQAGVPSHGAAATLLPLGTGAGDNLRGVALATEPLLDHLEVPDHLRAALDRGEVVMATPAPASIETAKIHLPLGFSVSEAGPGPELPFGGSFESPQASEVMDYLLIGEAGLDRAGLGTAPSPTTLVVLPDDVTPAEFDRLELLRGDLEWERRGTIPDGSWFVDVYLAGAPPVIGEAQIKALLLLFATLLVLAVVAVGLALAAQDEAEERQILEAVGAPPRTVRRATASKAALLAFIAGALAVPAGLLPAATIVAAATPDGSGDDWRFRPDAPSLLLVLFVVPLVAGVATWAGGRVRAWVRPTRPDVFAFGD